MDTPLSSDPQGLQVPEPQPETLLTLARFGLLKPFLRQQLLSAALDPEPLSGEDSQQALRRFTQEHGITDSDALERFRLANLLSPEALIAEAELPLRVQRHCERFYRPKAEARFLERKHQLDRVVYSLLRLADEGLARELYLRLLEREADFADLAASYAEGPERATRGIVGPAPLAQAHPRLVERLRTAAPGVVQEPFRIEQWWLVVRLESLTPASFNDAMALQMSQELLEQWLEMAVESKLQQLRPQLMSLLSPALAQPE